MAPRGASRERPPCGAASSIRPPMPAFQTLLNPEDIWKLVAYIKSLQSVKE